MEIIDAFPERSFGKGEGFAILRNEDSGSTSAVAPLSHNLHFETVSGEPCWIAEVRKDRLVKSSSWPVDMQVWQPSAVFAGL